MDFAVLPKTECQQFFNSSGGEISIEGIFQKQAFDIILCSFSAVRMEVDHHRINSTVHLALDIGNRLFLNRFVLFCFIHKHSFPESKGRHRNGISPCDS